MNSISNYFLCIGLLLFIQSLSANYINIAQNTKQIHTANRDHSSELELGEMLGKGTFGKEEVPGKGSSSRVFRALHKTTGAPVAVKVVPYQEGAEEANRIMTEIDILSKCNSPNIVRFLEARMEAENIWIAT